MITAHRHIMVMDNVQQTIDPFHPQRTEWTVSRNFN